MTTRVPPALLLLLLLPAAMPVSPASAARSNTSTTSPPSAPPAPATDGVELHEVSIAGVLLTKVSSSEAPGAATSPLPARGATTAASNYSSAARKLIPPSGPSDGSNSYRIQPPPA